MFLFLLLLKGLASGLSQAHLPDQSHWDW